MYLLFGDDNYYPFGAACDYIGAFATAEEAKNAFDRKKDNAEVIRVDANGLTLVSVGMFVRVDKKSGAYHNQEFRWLDVEVPLPSSDAVYDARKQLLES